MGGVITVSLRSIGQPDSGLSDGQQRPELILPSRLINDLFPPQRHTQDRFVYKMGRAVSSLEEFQMEDVHFVCVCE